jgi:hypothetical protein
MRGRFDSIARSSSLSESSAKLRTFSFVAGLIVIAKTESTPLLRLRRDPAAGTAFALTNRMAEAAVTQAKHGPAYDGLPCRYSNAADPRRCMKYPVSEQWSLFGAETR